MATEEIEHFLFEDSENEPAELSSSGPEGSVESGETEEEGTTF